MGKLCLLAACLLNMGDSRALTTLLLSAYEIQLSNPGQMAQSEHRVHTTMHRWCMIYVVEQIQSQQGHATKALLCTTQQM